LLLKRQSAHILTAGNYLVVMLKNVFRPRVPTRRTKVPDRPEWIHEIKNDGYRLIIQRDGRRMRSVYAQRP
jgi:ATP-dependent DNA ligase